MKILQYFFGWPSSKKINEICLDNPYFQDYSAVKCEFEHLIENYISKCQCIPSYIHTNHQVNKLVHELVQNYANEIESEQLEEIELYDNKTRCILVV